MSTSTSYDGAVSDKTWSTTLMLCIFLGGFAGHRFYVGKTGSAFLFIVTAGGFLIWWLMDLIKIIKGEFTDSEGRPIPKP
jgi:TM2 domain-containing membrane protein YozV